MLVSVIGGNQHAVFSTIQHPQPFDFMLPDSNGQEPTIDAASIIPFRTLYSYFRVALRDGDGETIRAFRKATSARMIHLLAPPPKNSNAWIEQHHDTLFVTEGIARSGLQPAAASEILAPANMAMEDICSDVDVEVLSSPAGASEAGEVPLPPVFRWRCYPRKSAIWEARAAATRRMSGRRWCSRGRVYMSEHPYQSLPDMAFWRKAVATPQMREVDPVGSFDVKIGPETKVATAGSCFAQHIARYLRDYGYNFFVAEPGHPILPDSVREANNYGLFSCRYGNTYTARQLASLWSARMAASSLARICGSMGLRMCETRSGLQPNPAASSQKWRCALIESNTSRP